MQLPLLKYEDVTERLSFAKRRLQDLINLNSGDLSGADSSERQQLVQEFFFHLIGSTEVLAQLVNESCGIGLDSEKASVKTVFEKLTSGKLKSLLSSLYQNTRTSPFPADPYSDEGYIYRILNYRHQVTHRRSNPFFFRVYFGSASSSPRESLLMLDPRDPDIGPSNRLALDELAYMYSLVESRCVEILGVL